jgi:hypothetical protein
MKNVSLHIYREVGGPMNAFYKLAISQPGLNFGIGRQVEFYSWSPVADLFMQNLHIDQAACDAIKMMADVDGSAELEDLELSDDAAKQFGFIV